MRRYDGPFDFDAAAGLRRRARFAADARTAADVRETAAAGGLEDLSSGLDDFGDMPPRPPHLDLGALARMRAELSTKIQQTKQRVFDARRAAEEWDRRRKQAVDAGRDDLANEAARTADAERARMHVALRELGDLEQENERLEQAAVAAAAEAKRAQTRRASPGAGTKRRGGGSKRSTPGRGSVDDLLADMKRKQGASASTVDDELAALKARMGDKGKQR